MDPQTLRSQLTGVVGFPVTIFKDDLSLDLDGLRANLEFMLTQPFCAIVAAGGTGELYSLTPEEHLQVVKTTVEVVGGKMPVIAGTGYGVALGSLLARQARDAGADGILAFPPYYPGAHREGLAQYYQAIGKSTDLGLLVYSRDWANFKPEEVEQLADMIPTLVAWKDGQADIRRYQMIMNRLGDRLHWIGGAGDDMVPAYYTMGIRTYTSSISNIAPKLSIALHELGAARKEAELDAVIRELVVPLYEFRTARKGYEVSAMKWMMDRMGLQGGPSRPPLVEVLPHEEEFLGKLTEGYKAWL